ncbi:MAG: peptidase U32 family protein [Candidatus Izemoplasmataceae bacterium]
MKLAVTLNHIDSLNILLKKDIHAIIIGLSNFAQRLETTFDIETITRLVNDIKAHDKAVYISMNILIHDDFVPALYEALDALKNLSIDGILFADLAVYMAAKERNLSHLLIYYPETYVTSLDDVTFWHNQKIKAVILARELTLDDIEYIIKNSVLPIMTVGHGYLNMFHSRRALVENYFLYTKDQDPNAVKDSKNLTLIEEKRNEKLKIIQDEFGTHIFRSKPLHSFKVLNVLRNHLDTLIIDTTFFNGDESIKIIDDYLKALNNQDIDLSYYEKTHDEGFYYKKTVLKKEGDA